MKYQIAKICLETTREGVEKALVELPHDLDEMYLDILRSIRKRYKGVPRTVTMAENALHWTLRAVRPLTPVELLEAICIAPGQSKTGLASNDVTVQTVLDICQPLLVLDRGSEVVRFAHFSVHEFLLKEYTIQESHTLLAETCLTLLMNADSNTRRLPFRRPTICGILAYATHNLATHVRLSGAGGVCLTPLWKSFFTPGPAFQIWFSNVSIRNKELLPPKSGSLEPLLVACYYGLVDICASLLRAKADTDPRNHSGGSSLHIAAIKGHPDITRLLLEHNSVSVNCTDRQLQTPLHLVATSGHEEIVGILLDNGAHVDVADIKGGTPLSVASKGRREAIVKMLLDKGANINTADSYSMTPLLLALLYLNPRIAVMLLDRGANVNAANTDGLTPLHQASRNGYEGIVEMLLDKGADVNAADIEGGTALHYAASSGHERIVKLLLDKYPPVNSRDYRGRTPLSCAMDGGHDGIVEILQRSGGYLH